ncbi:ParB/RepB/Spo0J family partition protein [Methylibium sp.]|uniref:ParB/RepB/Spo0J family partition protein n=1 Tax=Methylibium sp. TaxID=2067992 RepID=UPI003D139779
MDETITRIELDRLRESPTNPRREFDAAYLGELSLSIASQGVIHPIIVRPAPDRPRDQRNLQVTHEIVVGHCRYRASLLAKLLDIPCIVRDLDDEQVRVAQIHENLHRKDVNPIEEADGLAELASVHKVKVEDLVKRTGKSRSYVYGRIRLASAAPEVREACLTGGLGGEIGTRIARIPSHKLQKAALEKARVMTYDFDLQANKQSGWISDRQAKHEFSRFTIALEGAPFDPADAKLAALAGACTACPKRAGNDPDLSTDLEPDTCTDTECYKTKVQAHALKAIAAARKAGRMVIDGDAAKAVKPHRYDHLQGYEHLDQDAFDEAGPEEEDSRFVTWREALERIGKKAPKPALLVDPYDESQTLDVLTAEQCAQVLGILGVNIDGPTPSTAAQAREGAQPGMAWPFPRELDTRTPEERAVALPAWSLVQQSIMEAAAAQEERTAAELLLVARSIVQDRGDLPDDVMHAMGWSAELEAAAEADSHDNEETWCLERFERCTPAELARFMVLMAISMAPVEYSGEKARDEKLALAQMYGVDVVAAARLKDQTDDAGSAGGSDAQGELLEETEQ